MNPIKERRAVAAVYTALTTWCLVATVATMTAALMGAGWRWWLLTAACAWMAHIVWGMREQAREELADETRAGGWS